MVQVRGKESIVEELNMGPDATELWRKIQYLVAHLDEIQDFSKLVKLFDLTITDPIDTVSPRKPGVQRRYDIKGGRDSYLFESIGYGIGQNSIDKNKRGIGFTLDFYLNGICISNSEVRRVYGKGSVGIPTHAAQSFYSNPAELAGLMFSEAYGEQDPNGRNAPIVFSYVNSGCLKRIQFVEPISE